MRHAVRLLPLLLLAATACLHGAKVERTLNLPAALEISAITVEPVSFRWDQPAYRGLDLAQRMLDLGIQRHADALYFFGDWEATPHGEGQPKRVEPTPVLALLAPYGVDGARLVQFRPWAEIRVQSGQPAVHGTKGDFAGQARTEALAYIAHLDVVTALTAETVAEFKAEVNADPFAERGDNGDPAPELTRLFLALMSDALNSLRSQFREPAAQPRAFNGKLHFAPQRTFAFIQTEDALSLQPPLRTGRARDQEVMKCDRILFANPGIDDATAATLAATNGGLYVAAADASLDLAIGDLILEIDRKPAQRQHLHRALLAPSPTELLVKRANGDETVVIIK